MDMTMTDQWRAQFDAHVTFTNGGGLEAHAFRLDIPERNISDEDLAALFVRHLGLLMVDEVRIANKMVIREAHKGSRVVPKTTNGARGRRLVELSHPIRDGMITYPGLPGPEITDHLTREASRRTYGPGTEFQIGRISLIGNTGTYLDAPSHRFADGADLAGLPLDRLVDLEGVILRVVGGSDRAIDRNVFLPLDLTGKAVLVHTGWDRHWGTEAYGSGHPFLTADAVAWLVEQGAALVGIDSLNIDDTADLARPAHTGLLRAGIPIVEHLCGLDQLPVSGFRFSAAPPRISGMSGFPIRAYAVIDEG